LDSLTLVPGHCISGSLKVMMGTVWCRKKSWNLLIVLLKISVKLALSSCFIIKINGCIMLGIFDFIIDIEFLTVIRELKYGSACAIITGMLI
jgi:hypothetical protein